MTIHPDTSPDNVGTGPPLRESTKFAANVLTIEALPRSVHPAIDKYAAELKKRLLALEHEPDEIILSARIVIRNGVPRKIKWTREEEACYS